MEQNNAYTGYRYSDIAIQVLDTELLCRPRREPERRFVTEANDSVAHQSWHKPSSTRAPSFNYCALGEGS